MIPKRLGEIIDSRIPLSLQKDLIQLRESIHREPELSNCEYKTQEKLLNALKHCNLRGIDTVKTGIVARIKGQDASLPPLAIRGDIDALPIEENTQLSFQSLTKGVMHACGHDVHATWAIGAARLLSISPPPSDVIIIFQPAEELATGAKLMLDSGLIPNDVQAIFGAHVDRQYPIGEVVIHDGAISSFSDKFTIEIIGKSAHAARPEEGVNPIPFLLKCCEQIEDLRMSVGEEVNSNLITITQVNAGQRHNIIPKQAIIQGTIRCLSSKIRKLFHDGLYQLESQSDVVIKLTIQALSPAIINSQELKSNVVSAVSSIVGSEGLVALHKPNLASEDFGFYRSQYPGWFFRIGVRYSNDSFIPVHTPEFYAEQESIFIGALVLAQCVQSFPFST